MLYCPPHDAFTEAQVQEILTVNLRAPVALIEALAPQMKKRKSGRIVNVGSVAAFTGHPDLWYGATKAALLNITKSYAGYLGKDGILVNAVAPGPTLTAMYEQLPQSRKDAVTRSVYSGRACQSRGSGAGDLLARHVSPSTSRDDRRRQQRLLSPLGLHDLRRASEPLPRPTSLHAASPLHAVITLASCPRN